MSEVELYGSSRIIKDADSDGLGGHESQFMSTTKTSHFVSNASWIPQQVER